MAIDEVNLTRLAITESRARQHFEALGMLNAFGRTAAEEEAARVEYALAQARWINARAELRDAIAKIEEQSQYC